MIEGRVLAAHNAQFDYDFLAYGFARARRWLLASQRLCTLALNPPRGAHPRHEADLAGRTLRRTAAACPRA